MTSISHSFPARLSAISLALFAGWLSTGAGEAYAQSATPGPASAARATAASALNNGQAPAPGWQTCRAMTGDAAAQLKCFQDWAAAETRATPANTATTSGSTTPPAVAVVPPNPITGQPAIPVMVLPSTTTEAPDGKPIGCRNDKYSDLSKFWELQRGTDCDTFSLRGYRPITLAIVASGAVNDQPTSTAAGHSPTTPQPYRKVETKIQLSVRTKIAKGLLKDGPNDEDDHDSLWFGYTQQSYWQLFTSALSRPFRNTDHEPELIYIYPHQIDLPGGFKYRLSGLGFVHQSNGQTLPLSRSWNRVYLMGAAEKELSPTSSITVQARVWDRLKESSGSDDNPGIENYIGRGELAANWRVNATNTLGVTLRHSLKSEARGSTRLDWMMAPKSSPTYTGLRYHIQFFSGYGDSLLDYNVRRNVLSVGLSLVDW